MAKIFKFEDNQHDVWKSKPPDNRYRRIAWTIGSAPAFDNVILGVIMVNVVVMAMDFWGASHTYELAVAFLNAALTLVFVLEALLKVVALGPLRYWSSNWNRLDLVIVAAGIAEFILLIAAVSADSAFVTVLRLLR